MRMVRSIAIAIATVGFAFAAAAPAAAQPLGSFRWQLQPYCNVITLAVVQQGGQYQLDGLDDQCGAAVQASVVGLAFQNPNGSIGFGLNIVTAPGGTPVHVDATISIATLSGTWRDSAGNSGTFIFTPGAGVPGAPRPVPSGGLPANSVTTIQIAPAAVTNVQIANNAVTGASVLDGSLTSADLADAPRTAAVEPPDATLTGADTVVAQVTITAPAAGRIIANASGYYYTIDSATLDTARCSLTTGTSLDINRMAYLRENAAGSLYGTPFGLTRGFAVVAGSSTTVRLVCNVFSGSAQARSLSLTAMFVAGS